jgi:hypothetical protein
MTPAVVLCLGDEPHGVVEGEAEDLDVEVNGVTGQIALRPAPVAVFDDEAGIGGQGKVVRLAYDELESALLQEWGQRDQPGGADLLARPAWSLPTVLIIGGCHSLSSSGVG